MIGRLYSVCEILITVPDVIHKLRHTSSILVENNELNIARPCPSRRFLIMICFVTVPNVVNSSDVMMNINGKESLWIDRGWRTGDVDKDSGLSGMKLLANSQMSSSQGNYTDCGTDYAEVDPRNMSTFYNCRKSPDNPTPYATTMLINSMPQEICANPNHSHSEHEICAGGSSGTSSLHSDGKHYCMHAKHYAPGEEEAAMSAKEILIKFLLQHQQIGSIFFPHHPCILRPFRK